jgi:hypothetical protein
VLGPHSGPYEVLKACIPFLTFNKVEYSPPCFRVFRRELPSHPDRIRESFCL